MNAQTVGQSHKSLPFTKAQVSTSGCRGGVHTQVVREAGWRDDGSLGHGHRCSPCVCGERRRETEGDLCARRVSLHPLEIADEPLTRINKQLFRINK